MIADWQARDKKEANISPLLPHVHSRSVRQLR